MATKPANAKKRLKRQLPYFDSIESSYAVFMKHVKYKDDGIDASGVVSPQCYKNWLETRIKKPAKPAESFRRALTAHCRGDDGRRPFPEEVEIALLKELRKKKIWECFRVLNMNIGQRGYKAPGYWEKKRLAEEIEQTDGKTDAEIEPETEPTNVFTKTNYRKEHRIKHEKMPEQMLKFTENEIHMKKITVEHKLNQDIDLFDVSNVKPEKKIFENDNAVPAPHVVFTTEAERAGFDVNHHIESAESELIEDVDSDSIITFSELISAQELAGPTPLVPCSNESVNQSMNFLVDAAKLGHNNSSKVAKILLKFNSHHSAMRLFLMSTLSHMNFNMFNHETMGEMEKMHEHYGNNILFSRNFILPTRNMCRFDPSRPVGYTMGDTVTFLVIECDENAKQIYRGDITSKHSAQLRLNTAHSMMFLPEILGIYMATGEVWTRSLERRIDGTPVILLNRYTSLPGEPHINHCQMQDITYIYGHLLSPSLFDSENKPMSLKRIMS